MDHECKMWFGTQDFSTWIEPPLSGADASPWAWMNGGGYLNGGGYQENSFNSHKNYVYSWPASSSREDAQLMKSFYDGSFGRGKIFFHEPTTYDTNVLPARWADPSVTCGLEGAPLVPRTEPRAVPTSAFRKNLLPVKSAQYDLSGILAVPVSPGPPPQVSLGNPDLIGALYVTIPDGMQLNVGAFYSSTTNDAGLYVTPATLGGAPTGAFTRLTAIDNDSSTLFPDTFSKSPGIEGVYIWLGKVADVPAAVTIAAMHARLSPAGSPPGGEQRWVGGQGNAGVKFSAPPTYVTHNGVNGGQVEYAASFREVL